MDNGNTQLINAMMTRHLNNIDRNNMDDKNYQREAIRWILERELVGLGGSHMTHYKECGRGGILALEMGLGKTMLMLSTILCNIKAPEENIRGGTLIIVPCNLLDQWAKAIERFIGVKPMLYYGYGAKKHNIRDLTGPNSYVVITSYGTVNKSWREKSGVLPDRSPLTRVKWGRVICDEAHHLRSYKGGLYRNVHLIKSDIKWMLTGTPINNRLSDLSSLFRLVGMPREVINQYMYVLNNRYDIIKQNVLYNSKTAVGIHLPKMETHVVNVYVDNENEKKIVDDMHLLLNQQLSHFREFRSYKSIDKFNVDQIIKDLFENKSYFELTVRARQSCIIPISLRNVIQNKRIMREINGEINHDTNNLRMVEQQSKITSVINKVIENQNNNNGKLIFCHYRDEMDAIYNGIKKKNPYLVVQKIDGRSTKSEKKYALQTVITGSDWLDIMMNKKILNINTVNMIPELVRSFLVPDVLILQINSCCEGLNLQHFNEVYFTSPHWNPAVEDQAIARIHRIGQKRNVHVFKFITSSKNLNAACTMDEYCNIIQECKRELMYDNIIHPENLFMINNE